MLSANFKASLDVVESDRSALARTLTRLADINSGSLNARGVNRVGEAVTALFEPLAPVVERLNVTPFESVDLTGEIRRHSLGRAVRLRKHRSAPLQAFLCGHLDTVFGPEHAFQNTRAIDDDTLNGPGVADLKGGIVVMLQALTALEASPWAGRLGWEVLLSPDEEIGSPGSAPLLTEAAGRNHVGLLFEPAMPDGALAYNRKGSGNFTVVVRGRAAHAGREHHLGRNAIRALADFVAAVDDINGQRDGVTVNPGFIHGGGPVNIVPDTALMRFNVRLEQPEDEGWVEARIQTVLREINARNGIQATLHGSFGRKPKRLTPANEALFEYLHDCGEALGLDVRWRDTGGCCDGNNLAAAGLPNIDTLGAVGAHIHSADERVSLASITERARLTALLLMRLASGELRLPAPSSEGSRSC